MQTEALIATLENLRRELVQVRQILAERLPTAEELEARRRVETAQDPVRQLVTLDQIAAAVHRSKSCLQHRSGRTGLQGQTRMPDPDHPGRRNHPARWRWSRIRPWLIETFGGRALPEVFPLACPLDLGAVSAPGGAATTT